MQSPIHPEVKLVKSELEPGLTSWRCPSSGGHWIPAPSYWKWHSTQAPQQVDADKQDRKLSQSDSADPHSSPGRPAMLCPETHCLLVRYKVAGLGIYIDRSPICGGIWLDSGQWNLLKENGIHRTLHEIFTTTYQRQLHRKEAREALMHQFYTDLGEEVAEDLEHLAKWLKIHPKRRRIIAWLYEQLIFDEGETEYDCSEELVINFSDPV